MGVMIFTVRMLLASLTDSLSAEILNIQST